MLMMLGSRGAQRLTDIPRHAAGPQTAPRKRPRDPLEGTNMLNTMMRVAHRRRDDEGATAVEYGLMVAAIAAIIVLIVFAIGKFTKGAFKQTCDGLASGGLSSTY